MAMSSAQGSGGALVRPQYGVKPVPKTAKPTIKHAPAPAPKKGK